MTVATVYTRPSDSWASLQVATGLDRAALLDLNPHLHAVQEIEAGIPIDIPRDVRAQVFTRSYALLGATTPYEVARKELLMDIAEDPRPGRDNPRIRL